MGRRLSVLAGVGALIAAGAASAQPAPIEAGRFEVKNLGDLVAICSVGEGDPHYLEAAGYCNGYGRGAIDYHRATVPANAPPLFCAPAGTQPATTRASFLSWARANPARLTGSAVEGVFAFLVQTYPCPARRR